MLLLYYIIAEWKDWPSDISRLL